MIMDAAFDLDDYVDAGIVKRAFPLHDDKDVKMILDIWNMGVMPHPLDALGEYFMSSEKNQCLHVNVLAAYFGEKVGMYFGWLSFYTAWLLPAGLAGCAVTAWQLYLGMVEGKVLAESLDNPGVMMYAG